jgi:hypothetical protein
MRLLNALNFYCLGLRFTLWAVVLKSNQNAGNTLKLLSIDVWLGGQRTQKPVDFVLGSVFTNK